MQHYRVQVVKAASMELPNDVKIAVIGGSGLYSLDGITVVGEVNPLTPWGHPSGESGHGRRDECISITASGHGVRTHVNELEGCCKITFAFPAPCLNGLEFVDIKGRLSSIIADSVAPYI